MHCLVFWTFLCGLVVNILCRVCLISDTGLLLYCSLMSLRMADLHFQNAFNIWDIDSVYVCFICCSLAHSPRSFFKMETVKYFGYLFKARSWLIFITSVEYSCFPLQMVVALLIRLCTASRLMWGGLLELKTAASMCGFFIYLGH